MTGAVADACARGTARQWRFAPARRDAAAAISQLVTRAQHHSTTHAGDARGACDGRVCRGAHERCAARQSYGGSAGGDGVAAGHGDRGGAGGAVRRAAAFVAAFAPRPARRAVCRSAQHWHDPHSVWRAPAAPPRCGAVGAVRAMSASASRPAARRRASSRPERPEYGRQDAARERFFIEHASSLMARHAEYRKERAHASFVLELPAEESQHARSRRLRDGARVEIIDGTGALLEGELCDHGRGARIVAAHPDADDAAGGVDTPGRLRPRIHAVVATPKSSQRADWTVEKLSELGVDRLRHLACHRLEVADARRAVQRRAASRWHRLCVASAKQSLRRRLMQVDSDVVTVAQLAAEATGDGAGDARAHSRNDGEQAGGASSSSSMSVCVLATPHGEPLFTTAGADASPPPDTSLPSPSPSPSPPALSSSPSLPASASSPSSSSPSCLTTALQAATQQRCRKIEFIVGPEGGLTPDEERQLVRAGVHPVSLGDTRLRTETAAMTLAAHFALLRAAR